MDNLFSSSENQPTWTAAHNLSCVFFLIRFGVYLVYRDKSVKTINPVKYIYFVYIQRALSNLWLDTFPMQCQRRRKTVNRMALWTSEANMVLKKSSSSVRWIRSNHVLLGWLVLHTSKNYQCCIFLQSCSYLSTDLRTVFVFALGPFLPMHCNAMQC